jgi:tungstate transport system substrate-binding protein
LAVLLLATISTVACSRGAPRLRLATATSVQDSGLLDVLLPAFTRATGIPVDAVAVGSGAAFTLGREGKADLLLVDDRQGEDAFLAARDGLSRQTFMWNTYELLGPALDPAGVRRAGTASEAFGRIATAGATFMSRGDDSGTHRREWALWEAAGGRRDWPGYRESGENMAATLRLANEAGAYILTDRATRLGYKGQLGLVSLLADTPELRHEYSVMLLNPSKHPDLAHDAARRFVDWVATAEATRLIADLRVAGEAPFQPLSAAP